MRPLTDIERRGLTKLAYDTIFVKPLWVSDLWHAALIAAAATGAIVLSRTGESSVATVWPVNAVLGYWLVLNPVARWARVLSYFYVTLLSVNLLMGNPLAASAMLTAVNVLEAGTAILFSRTVFGMFVKDRLVNITRLSIPALFKCVGFGTLGLLGTALLGGVIISHFFAGPVLTNSWTWFNGSALGWFTIMPISVGILMEQHWGYPKLKSVLKPFWLVLPSLCLALWASLEANIPGTPVVSFVALTLLGLFLPSLWQAGAVLACLNIVFMSWWHFNAAFINITPPAYLVIVFILFAIILGVFIIRKTQERVERERDLMALEGPSNTVSLDVAGNIVSCTQRLAALVGQERGQLIGQNLMDVLQVTAKEGQGSPSLPPLRASTWTCAPSGNLATRRVEIITTETSDRTMPFTYICAIRDRSDTLRAEEARIAQIERSQAIILTQDKDWNTVHCSDGWCETMGYSREETIGQDLHVFFANDEMRAHGEAIRGERPSDQSAIIEDTTNYALRTKSGDIRLVKIRSSYSGNQPDINTATLQDVTEIVLAEAEAQTLLAAGTSAYFIHDDCFQLEYVSGGACTLFGYENLESFPEMTDIFVDISVEQIQEAQKRFARIPTGEIWSSDIVDRVRTRSGEMKYVRMHRRWFETPGKPGRRLWSSIEDVSALEAARLNAESLLAAGTSAYTVVDEAFNRILVSETARELFGFGQETTIDAPYISWYKNLSEEERLAQVAQIKALETGAIWLAPGVDVLDTPDGRTVYVRRSCRWFPDPTGSGRLLWTNLEDVTELQEQKLTLETQKVALERQAETDPLTGVLNRLGIDKRLEVGERGRRERDLAIHLIDLDFFKAVNDTYSHRMGDDLLKAVAKTLKDCALEGDVVGRLGGEEFFIATQWVSEDHALAFGERLRKAIGTTTILSDGHELSRTASIGVTQLLRHEDFGQKLHLADLALADAKAEGRNRVVSANTAYTRKKRDEGAFITELDIVEGLERREFLYYAQPIYNTLSQRIEGFEALIRWQKPDGTLIPPSMFVDRFHKIVYRPGYLETRQEMRREIVRALRGFPNTYVSWNLELEQFGDDTFIDSVLDNSAELRKITSQSFVMEISEHAMGARVDMERIIPNLERLRNAGIKIALDDFGIEQSNIHRLTQLPIDIVKLDKSLVDRIETSEKDRATIRALSLLLNNLKIVAIAEGVETRAQSRLLHYARIYHQQGYLHARPLLPKDVQAEEPNIGYNPQMVGDDAMQLFLDRKRALDNDT